MEEGDVAGQALAKHIRVVSTLMHTDRHLRRLQPPVLPKYTINLGSLCSKALEQP